MRFRGVAYRAHHPRWSWAPTSGEGARLHGGRFNPKGVSALYLSLQTHTAILEANQGFGNRFPPLTLVAYDVDCSDLVDLTKKRAPRKHAFALADLNCAWLLLAASGADVPTWQLATRLINDGMAGIIIPSFAVGAGPDDKNLVLWRWSEELPHQVKVFDPDGRLTRGA